MYQREEILNLTVHLPHRWFHAVSRGRHTYSQPCAATHVPFFTGLDSTYSAHHHPHSPRGSGQMGCTLGHEFVPALDAGPNHVHEGVFSLSPPSRLTLSLTLSCRCHSRSDKSLWSGGLFCLPSTKTADKVIPLSQKWTDGRSKLLQELLQSMAIIKQFCYEIPFLKRQSSVDAVLSPVLLNFLITGLSLYRGHELRAVRSLLMIRSFNQVCS